MKRFISVCMVLAMLAVPVFECSALTTVVTTLASEKAVGKNATVYTSAIDAGNLTGHVGIQLISSAGSITITQQCSIDNSTWYDPVDPDGNAVGTVIATQTVTAGMYIAPDPVLGLYLRYKIVEGNVAATAVTIKLVSQRD